MLSLVTTSVLLFIISFFLYNLDLMLLIASYGHLTSCCLTRVMACCVLACFHPHLSSYPRSIDVIFQYLLQTRLKQKVAANLVAKERQRTAQLMRAGSMKNDKYDYQETADMESSVSTPSNSVQESPFNRDSLGETAINLDKVQT